MPRGKKNWYFCPACRQWTVTMDVDEGFTPYGMECQASIGCGYRATSMLYPEVRPIGAPEEVMVEFYKPSSAEYIALEPDLKRYVNDGGLLPRKVGDLRSLIMKGDT